MKDKYNNLTKEKIEEIIKDILYKKDTSRKFVAYCWGYIDENNNIRCKFLEEFDKYMKEEIKKYDKK